MYNAFLGFSEHDHSIIKAFMGYDHDTAKRFWKMVLKKYLGTEDEELCRAVENKARVIGYTRLLRRSIRRPDEEGAEKLIKYYKEHLIDVIHQVDTLTF